MGDEVRPSSEDLSPVNTEIDPTVGEVVRNQAGVMSAGKYSLVAGLFNQNSPVTKVSGQLSDVKAAHSTSSKRKLDCENDLNVRNEIIDQIIRE